MRSWTLNGASGFHDIHFPELSVRIPLVAALGFGIDYSLFQKKSYYRDHPETSRRLPTLRFNMAFTWV